ncbi:MAG: hypothetical protein P4L40_08355 [Terracidiphilus sp.]|nr:hypothetical protein [Terracidiphilus sp.]
MADDDGLSLRFGKRQFSDVAAGMQEVIASLRSAWDGEAKVLSGALRNYLDHVAQLLAEKHGGAGGPDALARRTGTAVNSILHSVKVEGTSWGSLKGSIGGVSYLAIHETGGVMTAKQRMLTIPLPAAMQSGRAPPFARQWKNTFVAKSKAGNLLIFQRRGNEIVPLYILVDSVRIPPRLGMEQTLKQEIPYFLDKATDAVVKDLMARLS